MWQSCEHVGAILNIREKFFSLDIFCECLLMDGLKQKIFSLIGYHEYGVLFSFQTYGKLGEYKKAFEEVFVNKIKFFWYIHIFEQ